MQKIKKLSPNLSELIVNQFEQSHLFTSKWLWARLIKSNYFSTSTLIFGRLRLVVLLDFNRSIIAIISLNHPLCLTEWMINERLTIAFSSSTKLHEERRTNEMHPPACWRQKLRLIVFSGWKNRSTPIGPTVISYAETYSFREKRMSRSRFNYESNVLKLSLRFNATNSLITGKFLPLRIIYIFYL